MHFTREDIEKIRQALWCSGRHGTRDTELGDAYLPLLGEELVPIVQDGRNMVARVCDIAKPLHPALIDQILTGVPLNDIIAGDQFGKHGHHPRPMHHGPVVGHHHPIDGLGNYPGGHPHKPCGCDAIDPAFIAGIY